MSDLIKRSDAIKAIEAEECLGYVECQSEWLYDRINAIPSADRPQGGWEIVALGWHTIRRCSNCKWTQTYSDPKYMGYRYNFCPHCGCRMKGADDETAND